MRARVAGPRLTTYRPAAGAAFAPTDITTLLEWHDASNAGSITASGSPARVSQWNDLTVNGYHLTQGTGASQPATGTRTQNSLNAIEFAGAARSMDSSPAADTQPTMVVTVLKYDSTGGQIVTGMNPMHTGINSGNYAIYAGAWGAGPAADTSAHMIESVGNGASSTITVDAGTPSTVNPGTSGLASPFRVGADGAGGQAFNGYLCELLLFTAAVTGTDLTNLRTYLKAKWGTP